MPKPRILVIEDERALTEPLSANLEREGFEVLVAHGWLTDAEALDRAQVERELERIHFAWLQRWRQPTLR